MIMKPQIINNGTTVDWAHLILRNSDLNLTNLQPAHSASVTRLTTTATSIK